MSTDNTQQAQDAREALDEFRIVRNLKGQETDSVMCMLLRGLMHLSDHDGASFESMLDQARADYQHDLTTGPKATFTDEEDEDIAA